MGDPIKVKAGFDFSAAIILVQLREQFPIAARLGLESPLHCLQESGLVAAAGREQVERHSHSVLVRCLRRLKANRLCHCGQFASHLKARPALYRMLACKRTRPSCKCTIPEPIGPNAS